MTGTQGHIHSAQEIEILRFEDPRGIHEQIRSDSRSRQYTRQQNLKLEVPLSCALT